MFGTVGDAATFIATMGEMQISYANKDLFKIAHALNIAYNKGMLDGLSKADHSDLVAETELNLSDSRSHLKIISHGAV